jgi:putative oxidoreductase
MTMVRFVARSLLAGYFVVHGANAVKNPDTFVADAEGVAGKLSPLLHRIAPDQISARIPDDTRSLVRLNGAVQVIGGLALASGIGRRAGAGALAAALIPTTLAEHAFWAVKNDPEARRAKLSQFLKNAGLLGGLLIAAGDTEGAPGIAWRTKHGLDSAKKSSKSGIESAKKSTGRTIKTAQREAKLAKRAARAELPF